jgi:hypothetical protein
MILTWLLIGIKLFHQRMVHFERATYIASSLINKKVGWCTWHLYNRCPPLSNKVGHVTQHLPVHHYDSVVNESHSSKTELTYPGTLFRTHSHYICKLLMSVGKDFRWGRRECKYLLCRYDEYKSISRGAQYVTLQKYFSHPSLVKYILFCNPTHKTETGAANRWGTTNSKPPGRIIMMGQSETLSNR